MSAHVQQASMVSGRSLVFMVTVALHVAAISALMAWKISEANSVKQAGSVAVRWLDPEKPKPKPVPQPATPDSTLATIAMVIPVSPVRPIEFPDDEPVIVGRPDRHDPPPAGGDAEPSVATPIAVETPLRFRAVRPSDDYYPANAIRLEQQGVVTVRTCVDAYGRLAARPSVVTGSRHRLLDDAAVTWAAEALRFTPATRDGAAIAACKDFRVNFTLH